MSGLILGSSSGYRKALMERLQVQFAVHAPEIDETEIKRSGRGPLDIAEELARRKAVAVAAEHPDAVVVGSDQVAVIDNDILDKPWTRDHCIEQLRRLRGREHRLVTSVTIVHPEGIRSFTDITRLTMRDLSDEEIERYVDAEQPFDCCGGYRIEGLGITLFERVDTRDHTAIIGLPLVQLSHELRKLGVPLP